MSAASTLRRVQPIGLQCPSPARKVHLRARGSRSQGGHRRVSPRGGVSPAPLCRSEEVHEMAEVLSFHHAQGRTAGFLEFADGLRRAGHSVHTPDLYAGRTFDSLDDGVTYAQEVCCRHGSRRRPARALAGPCSPPPACWSPCAPVDPRALGTTRPSGGQRAGHGRKVLPWPGSACGYSAFGQANWLQTSCALSGETVSKGRTSHSGGFTPSLRML